MSNPLLVAPPNEEATCPECGNEILLVQRFVEGFPAYYWVCSCILVDKSCDWMEAAFIQGGEQ